MRKTTASHKKDHGLAAPVSISNQRETGSPPTTRATPSRLPGEDRLVLTANRAYELYRERGYRDGCALEDWLEAEREVLSQIPPA